MAKQYKPKPMGYSVSALTVRPDQPNSSWGTTWTAAKSLREAMMWGTNHMKRGEGAYFSLVPLWGTVI